MQTVMIKGKLPGLNDYIRACRADARYGNRIKAETESLILWQLSRLRRIRTPCFICFQWNELNRRRDKDNVAFAKKFVLDALQRSGKLENDNNNCLEGFSDTFVYGKDYGVKITVWESGDEGSEEVKRWT